MENKLIEINRFETKVEIKVLNALKKIFNESDETYTEQEILELELVSTRDCANVCMIIGKTTESKLSLIRFVEKGETPLKDIFDFSDIKETGAKVSSNYLSNAINILKACGESLAIFSKKDYPVILENKHFKIAIAPRVDED